MKTLMMIICAICLAGCVTTTSTYTPTKKVRYYDDKGHYQGYSVETPYSTRYYDSKSRYIGRSK